MLMNESTRGMTLVELLVGMSLLAVLVAMGAPSLGLYLQNAKVSNAAATYFSGVQQARTEAIRRNVQTEFVLTDTAITTANLANALVPAVTGRNWVVRSRLDAVTFLPAIESKAGSEGDNSAAGTGVQVLGAAVPVVFDGRIPFNGLGASNAAYTLDITNPSGGLCVAAGGPIRCRRITVSAGGQVGICDPAALVGDSRAC